LEAREEDSLEGAAGIALVVMILASLAALPWGVKAAGGLAAGAGIGITGLLLLQNLAPRASRAKRPRRWLWGLWVIKFPILCSLLYFLIGREWVSPVAFCVGVGVVPATLTTITLWPRRKKTR